MSTLHRSRSALPQQESSPLRWPLLNSYTHDDAPAPAERETIVLDPHLVQQVPGKALPENSYDHQQNRQSTR